MLGAATEHARDAPIEELRLAAGWVVWRAVWLAAGWVVWLAVSNDDVTLVPIFPRRLRPSIPLAAIGR